MVLRVTVHGKLPLSAVGVMERCASTVCLCCTHRSRSAFADSDGSA